MHLVSRSCQGQGLINDGQRIDKDFGVFHRWCRISEIILCCNSVRWEGDEKWDVLTTGPGVIF